MLTNVGLLGALGLSNYGFALGASMRADLQGDYARLMAETMEYAKDGANWPSCDKGGLGERRLPR